ncbi:MAG: TonB-dependent receptor [Acidobacteriia bacterium]|nr:TonB-dependent receptor [Terriglobia bacterium]
MIQNRSRSYFGKIIVFLAFSLSEIFGQNTTSKKQKSLEIEPTVVTVSAEALPLSASSAAVTILTEEFIRGSHAGNMMDLLRQVPFLYLSQTGGRGGLTTVTIRGGDPNFTLVMVDGIPVNDPTNILGGSFDFSTLSVENIKQIEIVRGPMSALYGSESVGGVINIITRGGENEPNLFVNGILGNFNSRQIGFRTGGPLKSGNYSLAGSHFNVDEQTEKDGLSLGALSFNSSLPLGQDKFLQLTTRYQDSRARGFPENSGGPEFSILRESKIVNSKQLIFGLKHEQQYKSWWIYGFEFDLFSRWQDSLTPSILDAMPPSFRAQPSLNTQSDFQRIRYGFKSHLDLQPELSLNLGIKVRSEDGTNSTLIAEQFPSGFDLQRETLATYGELLYRSNQLTASFGGRLDNPEGFEMELSPRAGISWSFSEKSRVKASWGEGFKLPSFFALGEPNVGNPQLKPEKSQGIDIGTEHILGESGIKVSVSFFNNSFKDLIDFSPQLFQLVNRTEARTRGVEFGTVLPVKERWQIEGHLQFVDWKLYGTSEPLRDRPRWRGGTSLNWEVTRRTNLRWKTLWVGPRFDFQLPVQGREIVGGYSTSSLVLDYQLPYGLVAYSRVDNVFNRKYHEFIGFPNSGIYARVGLHYQILGH